MSYHGYVRTVGAKPTTPIVRWDLCRPKPKPVEPTAAQRVRDILYLATPKVEELEQLGSRQRARQVLRETAKETGFSVAEIIGPRRHHSLVRARCQAVQRVAAACPNWSSTQLGEFFKRDHTTILYALGRIKNKRRARE